MFDEIIGQENVKESLNLYLDGFKGSNYFPSTLFVAEKGAGKTLCARETAAAIKAIKNAKGIACPVLEINGSTLKKVRSFFQDIVYAHLIDSHAVVFIDEFHAVGDELTDALLSILQKNAEKSNIFSYDGNDVIFDFKKITWIAATSEPQLVFDPLRDRFSEINLQEPSISELARIIKKNTHFHAEDFVFEKISPFCRGNCRSAFDMSEKIDTYCYAKNKSVFEESDVDKLIKTLNIYPLGVREIELRILKHLSLTKECSLANLCSKTGLTKSSQQDAEKFLMKNSLLEIACKRRITHLGRHYLKNLEHNVS